MESRRNISDYYHEKIIMANQVPIVKEELIDYLLEGIPDVRLRDQARMQRFESISSLLEAFRNISLKSDTKKITNVQAKTEMSINTSLKPIRCYNCNLEGHISSACPNPRREKGSCFTCGSMDHLYQDCPRKQSVIPKTTINRPKSTNETTTALIESPKRKLAPEILTSNSNSEQLTSSGPKTPLDKTTRDYCVLLTEANENQYYVS